MNNTVEIYEKRRTCTRCGLYGTDRRKHKRVDGTTVLTWTATCSMCKNRPWKKYKKNYCEYCNFKPIHPCQLDIDHIDGDHSNNDSTNLQTLCANCHRLKTFQNKDNGGLVYE